MVPDLHIGDHLRGAVAGVDSQQAQPHAERDRGRLHHPGQLSAAHDSDDGKPEGSGRRHVVTVRAPSR